MRIDGAMKYFEVHLKTVPPVARSCTATPLSQTGSSSIRLDASRREKKRTTQNELATDCGEGPCNCQPAME